MSYTMDVTVAGAFDDVVDRTIEELEAEGFGVLSDIDVQQTLVEKLGADVGKYRILGACSPPLAHEALQEERQLGALLPCNVVVHETEAGDVTVSAVDPETLLAAVDNPALDPVATDVRERFERVLSELSTA